MESTFNLFSYLLYLILTIIISAAFLWIGMKAASIYAGMPNGGQYCDYLALVKVSAASAVVSFIPYVGWLLAWVVLFYMLKKETDAPFGEIIIMVLVSRFAAILITPFIWAIF